MLQPERPDFAGRWDVRWPLALAFGLWLTSAALLWFAILFLWRIF